MAEGCSGEEEEEEEGGRGAGKERAREDPRQKSNATEAGAAV